jgi:hypothetical protein
VAMRELRIHRAPQAGISRQKPLQLETPGERRVDATDNELRVLGGINSLPSVIVDREAKVPMILIKCPVTQEPLPTNMSMEIESFELSDLSRNSTSCAHCGGIHVWDKKDAHLAEL